MPSNSIKSKVGRKKFFSIDVIFGIIFLITSICIAIYFIKITSIRDTSNLENILFQIIIIATTSASSIFWGKKFTLDRIFKVFARGAFRKAYFLFISLARLNQNITKEIQINKNQNYLEKFQATVEAQVYMSMNSLEDWRDVIPGDVEELEQKLEEIKKFLDKGVYQK